MIHGVALGPKDANGNVINVTSNIPLMCPFEGDGKEFHLVAKEVFVKIIDLDDFHVLVVKLDVDVVVESMD